MGDGLSMHAVKDSLANPLKRGRENLKALAPPPSNENKGDRSFIGIHISVWQNILPYDNLS